MIIQNDIIELLNYDPETGIFSWKKKRRGIKRGIQLGCNNGFGYLRITVLGKSYYAHRLAWMYVYGEWPKDQIDHINGDPSDNRISNLRAVTGIENQQNKINLSTKNKSSLMGVSWHKKAKKWQAHVCIYKQRKYLGLFEDINEAHSAYLREKEKLKNAGSI